MATTSTKDFFGKKNSNFAKLKKNISLMFYNK